MEEIVFYTSGRPSRDEIFMEIVQVLSKRATCARGNQGALIVKDNRIVSTGYNGPPADSPHCNSEVCNIDTPCIRAIHAEINAILFAAKHGIATNGCTLYCTTVPCRKCAEAIIQAGIVRVFYAHNYRDPEGLNLLKEAGVEVILMRYHGKPTNNSNDT